MSSAAELRYRQNHAIILELIRINSPELFSISSIARRLHMHSKTIKRHLERLKDENFIIEAYSHARIRLFQWVSEEARA